MRERMSCQPAKPAEIQGGTLAERMVPRKWDLPDVANLQPVGKWPLFRLLQGCVTPCPNSPTALDGATILSARNDPRALPSGAGMTHSAGLF